MSSTCARGDGERGSDATWTTDASSRATCADEHDGVDARALPRDSVSMAPFEWLLDVLAEDARDASPSSSSSSSTPPPPAQPPPPPTFRPWSYDAYVHRLLTFRALTWFAQPAPLRAPIAARLGWINIDTNTLLCEHCHVVLRGVRVKPLHSSSSHTSTSANHLDDASIRSICQPWVDRLHHAHTASCVWRDNPSPASFLVLPPTPRELVAHVHKRCQTWRAAMAAGSTSLAHASAADVDSRISLSTSFHDAARATLVRGRRNNDEEPSLPPALELLVACGWFPAAALLRASEANMSVHIRRVLDSSQSSQLSQLLQSSQSSSSLRLLVCTSCGALVDPLHAGSAKRQKVGGTSAKDSSHGRDSRDDDTHAFDPLHDHRPFCVLLRAADSSLVASVLPESATSSSSSSSSSSTSSSSSLQPAAAPSALLGWQVQLLAWCAHLTQHTSGVASTSSDRSSNPRDRVARIRADFDRARRLLYGRIDPLRAFFF